MKKHLYRGLTAVSLATTLAVGITSCSLDRDPPLNELTTEQVYRDPANYRQILAKMYAGLVVTGQSTTGTQDIFGDDEGATSYSRLLWKLQELPTDHAVVAWGDGSIQDLNTNTWSPANNFVLGMYTRIFYEVGLCNEYLRQTTDGKLSDYGIGGADAERAREYRNDARYLRALAYYHGLDLFGNIPFVTENDPVGYFLPKQGNRAALYSYIEGELLTLEGALPASPEYGRAGKAAVQALLAHLYLNAQVYIGQAKNTEAATYAKKIIDNGDYQLADNYLQLFGADNGQKPELRREIIFPIICDGLQTQSFGGSTFLTSASAGAQFSFTEKGMGRNNAWGGIRSKAQLPLLWGDSATIASGGIADQRCAFFTTGQSFFIRQATGITNFRQGFAVRKWTNKDSNGNPGSDPTGTHADTDIPLFRLGEIYLTYAEAVMRGGAGDAGLALELVNKVRRRAYGFDPNVANAVSDVAAINPDFLLDERGRETYWEMYRRSDLIRFGKFISGYNWNYKGDVRDGQNLPAHFTIYPIPAADMAANPTLKQNPGY